MNIEEFREYCLAEKGAAEDFPFGDDTLVLKVGGKIFALLSLDGSATANLKCDPERAIGLRETYPSIIPGYHMNKRHWNTVQLDSPLPDVLIRELIDHSYQLVFASLPRKTREEIETTDN